MSHFSDPELSPVQWVEEQSTAMLALQKELENLREESHRARDREARRAQQDEELQKFHERCEQLEEERASTVCAVLLSSLVLTLSSRRPTLKLLNNYARTWRTCSMNCRTFVDGTMN